MQAFDVKKRGKVPLICLALCPEDDFPALTGFGVVGIQAEVDLVVVGQRLVKLAPGVVDIAAVGVGVGVFRVQPDCPGVVGDGLRQVVLLAMGQAAVVVDLGETGIEAQSPRHTRRLPCPTRPPRASRRLTRAAERVRYGRFQRLLQPIDRRGADRACLRPDPSLCKRRAWRLPLDEFSIVGQGPVLVVLSKVDERPMEKGLGETRIDLQGLGVVGQGLVLFALEHAGVAPGKQGIVVVRQ